MAHDWQLVQVPRHTDMESDPRDPTSPRPSSSLYADHGEQAAGRKRSWDADPYPGSDEQRDHHGYRDESRHFDERPTPFTSSALPPLSSSHDEHDRRLPPLRSGSGNGHGGMTHLPRLPPPPSSLSRSPPRLPGSSSLDHPRRLRSVSEAMVHGPPSFRSLFPPPLPPTSSASSSSSAAATSYDHNSGHGASLLPPPPPPSLTRLTAGIRRSHTMTSLRKAPQPSTWWSPPASDGSAEHSHDGRSPYTGAASAGTRSTMGTSPFPPPPPSAQAATIVGSGSRHGQYGGQHGSLPPPLSSAGGFGGSGEAQAGWYGTGGYGASAYGEVYGGGPGHYMGAGGMPGPYSGSKEAVVRRGEGHSAPASIGSSSSSPSSSSMHPGAHRHNSASSSTKPPLPPSSTAALNAKSHVPSACLNCKRAHLACDVNRPCRRCVNLGKTESCIDVQHKKRGRPRLRDREEALSATTASGAGGRPMGESRSDAMIDRQSGMEHIDEQQQAPTSMQNKASAAITGLPSTSSSTANTVVETQRNIDRW